MTNASSVGRGMDMGARCAWGLVLLVTALHFDFWNWDSTAVVFGFLPLGLAYQAGVSIAAALAWGLVMTFDWPTGIETWAEQPSGLKDRSGSESGGNG